jgi:hypothetical protein
MQAAKHAVDVLADAPALTAEFCGVFLISLTYLLATQLARRNLVICFAMFLMSCLCLTFNDFLCYFFCILQLPHIARRQSAIATVNICHLIVHAESTFTFDRKLPSLQHNGRSPCEGYVEL